MIGQWLKKVENFYEFIVALVIMIFKFFRFLIKSLRRSNRISVLRDLSCASSRIIIENFSKSQSDKNSHISTPSVIYIISVQS